jgi:hypothetical protein
VSAEAPERSSGRHLSIGEVLAQLRGEFPDITISKIRFLESQGLIDPERTPSGYRKFYPPDLERLRWILHQQREHFLPLRVIKDRLDAFGPAGAPMTEAMASTGGNGPTSAPRPAPAPPRPAASGEPPRAPSPQPSAPAPPRPTMPRPEPSVAPDRSPAPAPAPAPAPSAAPLPTPPAPPQREPERPGPERPGPERPAPEQPAPEQPAPAPLRAAPPLEATPPVEAAPPWKPPRREPPPPPPPPPKPDLPFDDFVDDAEDREEQLGAIHRPDNEPGSTNMTRSELLEATGLTDTQLDALEEFGIVVPLTGEGQLAQYDDEALNIAEIGGGFYARGIEPRHLKMYWHFAEREAALFGQVLVGYLRQRNPAARARLQEDLEELARLGREQLTE